MLDNKIVNQVQAGTSLKNASLTAEAHYNYRYNWEISKTVKPSEWNLFKGDTGTSKFTIAVTKSGPVREAYINGIISVTNVGAEATQGLTITIDLIKQPSTVILSGIPVDVSSNPVLDPGYPGETGNYPYSVNIPSDYIVPGATYKITAHIRINNHSGYITNPPTPFGPNPSNTAILPVSPTVINDSINVIDTNGSTYNFKESGYQSYEITYSCKDKGTHDNTATIVETGQYSTASVSVNCYELSISKTADTSYTRTYTWTIDKQVSEDGVTFGDPVDFTLEAGESHQAYYRVRVIPTPADVDFMVSGIITIKNPAPIAATINSITDTILALGELPSVDATVTCKDVIFPYNLAAGATITCDYFASLSDLTERTNTAKVTLQNYDYSSDEIASKSTTTDFTGEKQVIFSSEPSKIVDACISISDSLNGGDYKANAFDQTTQIINYKGTIGPYSLCGNTTVKNVANFITVPCKNSEATGATGSDAAIANVSISCSGCTHTIGYWKTHAGFTGNNPDLITPLLPQWLGTQGGSKTIKVDYAAQAMAILSVQQSSSNGISKLYAQLLAAKLNIAYGASGAPISSYISEADIFLAENNASDWDSLNTVQKDSVNSLAGTLDDYNNGRMGVPHCSESAEPSEPTIPEGEDQQEKDSKGTININISNCDNFKVIFNFNKDDSYKS